MASVCNTRLPAADILGKDASARGAVTEPEALGALCIPIVKDEEEPRFAGGSSLRRSPDFFIPLPSP